MSKIIPPCPRCGTNKQARPVGVVGDLFRCGKCGGVYDRFPDEGGDYSDHNPTARLERLERRKIFRKS